MSSVDPFAALFAQNAVEAALADLQLGIPLELLQIQVNVGDLLAATVLPARNGHDVLEILGKQIVAQLPATVRPGDTLLLEVTGSSGNRVLVSNLGTIDPEQPLPTAVLQAAKVVEEVQATAEESGTTEQKPAPPVAPPRAVFVAASVTRSAVADASPKPPAAPVEIKPAGIEARIAATRAAAPDATVPARVEARQSTAVPVTPNNAAAPPKAPAAPKIPVQIVARAPMSSQVRAQSVAANTPERLLQTLRVPVTTTTLAAARVAAEATRRLPEVLTRLEQALTAITKDARAATLRTISAFVAKIDPSNEATLPQQIASYVSHVADGSERKVVESLQAIAQADAPAVEDDAAQSGSSVVAIPNVITRAKTVERAAAVDHDLKSLVLSLASRPPAEHTPALAQALRDAIVTLTGAQLQNLQTNTPSSSVISLALPVFYKEGGQPAQLRIDRKNANGGKALDSDNFRVAFVLDTASLGTVAIDLQASQRRVSVNVRTENEKMVSPFKSTLSELVGRLERLRYRVARTSAEVAPRTTAAPSTTPAAPVSDRALDLRA